MHTGYWNNETKNPRGDDSTPGVPRKKREHLGRPCSDCKNAVEDSEGQLWQATLQNTPLQCLP